jgi:uncharacterized protein (TIGR03083 family)
MDRRDELLREEDRAWERFDELIDELPDERFTEPGLTEDWTVKDLLGHLAYWMAEAAHVFERQHYGTYEKSSLDVDAVNKDVYEAMKDLDLPTVRAELESARIRMLQELFALPELTPEAEEWFVESGPGHIEEHLPDLERFVRSKR